MEAEHGVREFVFTYYVQTINIHRFLEAAQKGLEYTPTINHQVCCELVAIHPSAQRRRILRTRVERVFEWNSVDDIWSADHKDMRLYIAVTFRLHLLCKIQNTIQVDLIVLILMYGYLYD